MSLSVLSVASEAVPLIKTGGLADVAGALPDAVAPHGVEMTTLLPGYPAVLAALAGAAVAARIDAIARLPAARLLEFELPGGVLAWAVDCPALYDRDGGPYQDASGGDWDDNPLRFGQLSRVAALLGATQSRGKPQGGSAEHNSLNTDRARLLY